jgi:tetratricopeptide (TPR) repeat protein
MLPSLERVVPGRWRSNRLASGLNLVLCLALLLSACAHQKGGTPDNEPTLKSLAQRTVDVQPNQVLASHAGQAIQAYRSFLDTAPAALQREEAMRRMGDLEMDSADSLSDEPQTSSAPDYRVAAVHYQELLKTFPSSPGNDRVLYQLARAQDQNGDLTAALATLDRLVRDYPATPTIQEAQFRRGELLFTAQDYVQAEAAYATVLQFAQGIYHDRALYMRGWSRFKQGRLEDALQDYFGVLDAKLAGLDSDSDSGPDVLQGLSRADRELVEDTFRVTSLCLANLQGAESIAPYLHSPQRQAYGFKVYEQLGALYLKQERVKDAADTFALFTRQSPQDTQAPLFQARVIGVYEQNGFANLALQAKKDYVERYGQSGTFRLANAQGWQKVQPLVQIRLTELARHYHAQAQSGRRGADYQEAVHWYREVLASFPADPQAARNNFLLAELLFEDNHPADAALEYEKSAYGYAAHADGADAGYSALLAYARQLVNAPAAQRAALQQTAVDSALRFAQRYDSEARAAPVLADAAQTLVALHQSESAAAVARQLLLRHPPAEQSRVAWEVLARTRFEAADYAGAELAFSQALALTSASSPERDALVQGHAAAIYKRGELSRSQGQSQEALAHFERAALSAAPKSEVQQAAIFDAAAERMQQKDWAGAAATLQDFRRRFADNPLQAQVTEKLAVAYSEQQQWGAAAAEFEAISSVQKDPERARLALWQAASLQARAVESAAKDGNASNTALAVNSSRLYTRYLAQYPQPVELAQEARWALARSAKAEANGARSQTLLQEIVRTEQTQTAGPRSRFLAASAALALAEPVARDYRRIALVEPLQKQLKLKKAKMEEALKAYALATDFGVADVSTEASYQIATVYRDFGRALMASERPKKLKALEREQYDVMLEEQAFPFEEKATGVYVLNAQRAATGLYDRWVQSSFDALRELLPVRYGKTERSGGGAAAVSAQAQALNQRAIAQRQAGDFAQARASYEEALALDPNYRDAILNLGILQDLYLGDARLAQALFERYLALTPEGDSTVSKWLTEIRNRKEKV